jgi:excisionase family DNA binding protein
LSTLADATSGDPYGRSMTMLWSCPQAECPPTDKPPRDVEEPGKVANSESNNVLSIQEVAKLLNVPVSTIYAWKRRGEGPPYDKVGRKLRYRKSDARKWLAEHLVSRAVCQSECRATYRLNAFTTVEDEDQRL